MQNAKILNFTGYLFKDLENLESIRDSILSLGKKLGIRGTILLAHEGINAMFAGKEASMRELQNHLINDLKFQGLKFKESWSDEIPFNRFLVRIKKELIPVGDPKIKPHEKTATHLSAEELHQWYQEGKNFVLLDTRNTYEVELGKFQNSVHLDLKYSRHFNDKIQDQSARQLLEKNIPIVSVCTGGIRCEKASAALMNAGYQDVYQLEGGIIKYLEKTSGEFFHGECFVFDNRVAVNHQLNPTDTKQCFGCRAVLVPKDQKHPNYKFGSHCPYCYAQKHGGEASSGDLHAGSHDHSKEVHHNR